MAVAARCQDRNRAGFVGRIAARPGPFTGDPMYHLMPLIDPAKDACGMCPRNPPRTWSIEQP
jgi:hypothetical protein